jgi:putative two-component system response regulator
VNGTGYPRGLRGDGIPLEGRIAAVADVFDALTSERVYQAAHPAEDARAILEAGRGTLFDPAVLDAFHAARDEIEAVRLSEVGVSAPSAGSGGAT